MGVFYILAIAASAVVYIIFEVAYREAQERSKD